jgi:Flp pilus assembly protein TadB
MFFLLPIIGVIILALIHLLLKVLVSPEVATKFMDRVKKIGEALRKEQQKKENEPKTSSVESFIRSRENRKAWKAINSGQIDNGQDPVLVQFRANQKMNGLLLAWVIFLTPVIWVYNMALIALCYWV